MHMACIFIIRVIFFIFMNTNKVGALCVVDQKKYALSSTEWGQAYSRDLSG